MANIFSIYKQVRPKKTILSDDFNGLQNALKTSLDTIGTQAPPGQFGVSSSFYCADPTTDDHSVNKRYLTANFATVAAPYITQCSDFADDAAASAALAQTIALGDVSAILDTKALLAGATGQNFSANTLIATTDVTVGGNSVYHAGNFNPALKADASSVSNVDNTSDANKPISSATQSALDAHDVVLASLPTHLFDSRLFSGI